MPPPWKDYTRDEVAELAANAPGLERNGERTCPSCGAQSVRFYYHEYDRRGSPVGMSYLWCKNCHRYTSSTGVAVSPSYEFNDPAEHDAKLAKLRKEDLPDLLDYLDSSWGKAGLPQKFKKKSRK